MTDRSESPRLTTVLRTTVALAVLVALTLQGSPAGANEASSPTAHVATTPPTQVPTCTAYDFDSRLELRALATSVAGSPVFDSTYTRDALGRITERVETTNGATHTFAYSYDTTGRLIQARRDGSVIESYAYDQAGNPTERTRSGVAKAAVYDDQDRLVSLGDATYTYSPAGRLATVVTPLGTTAYDYDAHGALLGVTLASGVRVDYVIDAAGRRIAKKVGGVVVEGYVWEGSRLVATTDATGAVASRFVYTTNTNTPSYMTRAGRTYRIVSDHLGSPRVVIDANSADVAQRIDYDSFGTVTSDTNEGFTPFGFAGGLYDPTTGLVRFGARDYDANAARWTAKDPAGFAGGDTSLYAYAGGDPVNFVDTSGLGFKLPGFIHIALDVVGVIPVIGDAVDLVHAGIYLAEGDCLNAALSLAAVIPIAGSAALGARYALKYGDEAVAGARVATKVPTPGVGSTKLQNIANDLYKGTTNPGRVGTGTTADALRYELSTGQQVFGKSHLQKAQDSLRGLENWLKANPSAPYHDRLVARSLADDLLDALAHAP